MGYALVDALDWAVRQIRIVLFAVVVCAVLLGSIGALLILARTK